MSYTINHVGLVVPNIEVHLKRYEPLYRGFTRRGPIRNDTQLVNELFLSDGRTTLELLEPARPGSPLDTFLNEHPLGGLAHVCYDCDDIDASIAELRVQGARVVVEPVPDVAFEGRRIAFLFLGGQLIELVQR